MKNPNHPIWFIIRFFGLLVFLLLFSWINASNWDETEAKMIAGVMAAYGASEWVIKKSGGD